jgi:hypothetical protein
LNPQCNAATSPGGIFQQRGKQQIDAAGAHAFDGHGSGPRRPGRSAGGHIGHQPGEVDGIAADIVERAAAELGLELDRRRIGEQKAKTRLDEFDFAERPAAHHVEHLAGAVGVAVHERLHERDAVRGAGGHHLAALRGIERDGLLAQDVFAEFGGADRPLAVERIGQRDVNGIDRGIVQQFLVIGIDAVATGETRAALGQLGLVVRGERIELRVAGAEDGGDDAFAGDAGVPEHAPADGAIERGHGHRIGRAESDGKARIESKTQL